MGINLIYGVLINSIFNTGVSIFVLISGYFGINRSLKKYLKLEIEVIFYSALSMLIVCIMQNNWELKDAVKALLPISSGKYWFLTSYMLLMFFSEYINKASEKMPQKEFEKLLLLMLFAFSILPTIVRFHIMNDNGKGFANMLLIYLIGRYIKLYRDTDIQYIKILAVGMGTAILGFVMNLTLTMLHGGKGVVAPYARDCSSIIIVVSISIFLLFKQLRVQSKAINCISSHVVAVYLFEGAVRTLIGQIFDIKLYGEKWYLFIVIGIYAVAVMALCMVTDIVRKILLRPVEDLTCFLGNKVCRMVCNWFDNCDKQRGKAKDILE